MSWVFFYKFPLINVPVIVLKNYPFIIMGSLRPSISLKEHSEKFTVKLEQNKYQQSNILQI